MKLIPNNMLTLIENVCTYAEQSLPEFTISEFNDNPEVLSAKMISALSKGLEDSVREAARKGLEQFLQGLLTARKLLFVRGINCVEVIGIGGGSVVDPARQHRQNRAGLHLGDHGPAWHRRGRWRSAFPRLHTRAALPRHLPTKSERSGGVETCPERVVGRGVYRPFRAFLMSRGGAGLITDC